MSFRKKKLIVRWINCRPLKPKGVRGRNASPVLTSRSGITATVATAGPAVRAGLPAGFFEPAPSPAVGSEHFVAALGLIARFPASIVADPVTAVGPAGTVADPVALVAVGRAVAVAVVPSSGPLDHPPFEFNGAACRMRSKPG